MRPALLAPLAIALLAVPAHAQSMEAHTHGHATITLAAEGNELELEMELPGESAVGFERAPSTDEERAAVDTATATLNDAASLFTLTEAAGCTVSETEVEFETEGEHAEFHAHYTMACDDIDALDQLTTTAFEAFPALEEVEVEYALPGGQGAGEMEPGEATVALR